MLGIVLLSCIIVIFVPLIIWHWNIYYKYKQGLGDNTQLQATITISLALFILSIYTIIHWPSINKANFEGSEGNKLNIKNGILKKYTRCKNRNVSIVTYIVKLEKIGLEFFFYNNDTLYCDTILKKQIVNFYKNVKLDSSLCYRKKGQKVMRIINDLKTDYWNENGKRTLVNGTGVIILYNNKKKCQESYYKNSKMLRNKQWYSNGKICSEVRFIILNKNV